MTSSMLGDFSFTITLWRRTSSGSWAEAQFTRFWVLTVFESPSVPMSNVTVIVAAPVSVALLDR